MRDMMRSIRYGCAIAGVLSLTACGGGGGGSSDGPMPVLVAVDLPLVSDPSDSNPPADDLPVALPEEPADDSPGPGTDAGTDPGGDGDNGPVANNPVNGSDGDTGTGPGPGSGDDDEEDVTDPLVGATLPTTDLDDGIVPTDEPLGRTGVPEPLSLGLSSMALAALAASLSRRRASVSDRC